MNSKEDSEVAAARGVTYRHKKRCTEYRLLALGTYISADHAKDDEDVYVAQAAPGVWHVKWAFTDVAGAAWARMQCGEAVRTGDVVAIYQSLDDAMIWVRPLGEFEDGRFELLEAERRTSAVGS